ncbi:alpha/beta fold hydrolase [Pseudomonas sp. TE50-2]|jgi:predicted alpha/beta hydrolase|uniref:alpha/beta hydrolase family protein n=1 Tax=Pseudomonas sp. TE50-2 TaxID=3142707 RepID=UPI0034655134
MVIRNIEFSCPDGVMLRGEYFEADTSAVGVVVVSGALGVRRNFYSKFATMAAGAGYDVMVYSYRGIERRAGRCERYRLSDWGEKDIGSAIQYCKRARPLLPIYFVGHSIGAQLLGLSAEAGNLKAAAFVGGSFPHWNRWSGKDRIKMFLFFKVIIPFISSLSRSFPARLFGLGSFSIPSSILLEWSRWVCDEKYLLSEKFGLLGKERYGSLGIPIISFVFEDDTYVPWRAAQIMHQAYKVASIDVRYKRVHEGAVGHFGFFRDRALQCELIDYFSRLR